MSRLCTSIVQIVITWWKFELWVRAEEVKHLQLEFKVLLCSHLLTVTLAQTAQEQNNESIELGDLLLVVILEGVLVPNIPFYYIHIIHVLVCVLVPLLQPVERVVHFGCPEDLSACQGNLRDVAN